MVDRAKDMIITGAENVYSVEVEAVLSAPPRRRRGRGLRRSRRALGRSGARRRRRVARTAAEELIAHCRARIAGFKVPRAIDVRREPLPKSGAGKLLK